MSFRRMKAKCRPENVLKECNKKYETIAETSFEHFGKQKKYIEKEGCTK